MSDACPGLRGEFVGCPALKIVGRIHQGVRRGIKRSAKYSRLAVVDGSQSVETNA